MTPQPATLRSSWRWPRSRACVTTTDLDGRVINSPTWSIQDAKNRFSEVVEAARRKPQTVTKHGKPAVVVLAVEKYERLRKLHRLKASSFAAVLLAMPHGHDEFERIKAKPRDVEF